MRLGYKLALLLIFGGPALFYGLKYALIGAYRGLVKRRIPMGEEAVTGWGAIAIGVYSVLMASGAIFAISYIAVWFFM